MGDYGGGGVSIDLDAIREQYSAAEATENDPDPSMLRQLTMWARLAQYIPTLVDALEAHEAEVERLRAQNVEMDDAIERLRSMLIDAETEAQMQAAEVERLRAENEALKAERRTWGGGYRYICEEGHTTVTTESRYDVCTAVLPWPSSPTSTTGSGVPCGAPTEYRVIPYDAEFDL